MKIIGIHNKKIFIKQNQSLLFRFAHVHLSITIIPYFFIKLITIIKTINDYNKWNTHIQKDKRDENP